MEDDKFDKLISELEKCDESIAEIKCKVATAQDRTAKDLTQKLRLNRLAYQFSKKSHEMQYAFNKNQFCWPNESCRKRILQKSYQVPRSTNI